MSMWGVFLSGHDQVNDSLEIRDQKEELVYVVGGIIQINFWLLILQWISAYVSRLFNSDASESIILDYVNDIKRNLTEMSLDEY